MLKSECNIDETDDEGRTGLVGAAAGGRVGAVAALCEAGAGVELGDGAGCRPLHHAAREGRPDCVQLLLERGASTECRDNNMWTPFLWAVYTGIVGKLMISSCSSADPVRAR